MTATAPRVRILGIDPGLRITGFGVIDKSGNTLDLRVAPEIGSIRTDRTKVKQCLLNVLSNASNFTHNENNNQPAK